MGKPLVLEFLCGAHLRAFLWDLTFEDILWVCPKITTLNMWRHIISFLFEYSTSSPHLRISILLKNVAFPPRCSWMFLLEWTLAKYWYCWVIPALHSDTSHIPVGIDRPRTSGDVDQWNHPREGKLIGNSSQIHVSLNILTMYKLSPNNAKNPLGSHRKGRLSLPGRPYHSTWKKHLDQSKWPHLSSWAAGWLVQHLAGADHLICLNIAVPNDHKRWTGICYITIY